MVKPVLREVLTVAVTTGVVLLTQDRPFEWSLGAAIAASLLLPYACAGHGWPPSCASPP